VLGAVGAVGTVVVGLLAAGAVFWLRLSVRPVLSPSMRPTYGPGWVIVTRSVPVSQIRPGDIVVITPPGSTVQVAHRVVTVSGPPRDPVITTKGDANPGPDPWRARLDGSQVPEVVGEAPALGYVLAFLEQGATRAVVVGVLGLGLATAGTSSILRAGQQPSARTAPAPAGPT
jgi:signal peptidase